MTSASQLGENPADQARMLMMLTKLQATNYKQFNINRYTEDTLMILTLTLETGHGLCASLKAIIDTW